VYKIYAESFRGAAHLHDLQQAARAIVAEALTRRGTPMATGEDQP
jgi:phosphoglucomutase